MRITVRAVLLAVLLGVFLGIAAFTAVYAEAASYLSTDPRACANCHIMNANLDSWQKASHHGVAVCVDCHLPHDFVGKYIAKADNGARHSWGFTFQHFREPIRMIPRSERNLERNCVRCHAAVADALVHATDRDGEAPSCLHCHYRVGHGDRVGLGGPAAPAEFELRGHDVQRH